MKKGNILLALVCTLLFAVVLVFGLKMPATNVVPTVSNQIRANISSYKFINPLLYSDDSKSSLPYFQNLASKISDTLQQTSVPVQTASVYFRELNSGRWTGINEDDKYSPSSMLKVIVAMSALKLAENDPKVLEKTLLYTPDNESQYYQPLNHLRAGDYRIDQLIQNSLVYSDNSANTALLSDPSINEAFKNTYSVFRLPTNNTADYMSPHSYSVVWRTLYNSSFFEWNISEQLLEMLSRTTFNSGLVAGVPTHMLVSHKFGENSSYAEDGKTVVHELHDCGIIYFPKDPYFLCVMTKGDSFSDLEKVIAQVSTTVYNYVDTNGASKTP